MTDAVRGPPAVGDTQTLLGLMAEELLAILWSTDCELRFTWCVGPGLAAVNLRPGQIVGTTLPEFFQTDDPDFPPIAAHRRALRGEEVSYELAWAGRAYHARVTPLRAEEGRIVGCIGVAQDITQRKRAEEALRRSERQASAAIEAAGGFTFSYDIATGKINWGGAIEEITGYTPEEFAQVDIEGWAERIHPDDKDEVLSILEEAIQERDRATAEYRFRTKKGYVTLASISITEQENGKAVRLVGILQDVTGRKRAEEALKKAHDELEMRVRERTAELATANRQLQEEVAERKEAEQALRVSEERFRLAFEEGPLGIAIVDPDGEFLQVNLALCRMLGYSRKELMGKTVSEITYPGDFGTDWPVASEAIKSGIPSYTVEKRYLRKDGEILWGRLTATTVRDAEGNVMYTQGMIENITQRKRAEEALRRADRLASIGTLAAGMAHEINNPLGAISLYAKIAMLAKDNPQIEETPETCLENIQQQVFRCSQIVKSILQFARQEESEKRPGDLGDVARQARDLTRGLASARQVEVLLELSGDLPEVLINPTEMEQVFVNLISNAVEASPPGGRVTVRLEPGRDTVRILIEDQGRGMGQEQVNRAFDPFYTTRHREGGSGLGLSITYGIVEQHGGTINLRSSPGKGTTVTLVLPRSEPAAKVLKHGEDPHR